jgi:hypothetical protein
VGVIFFIHDMTRQVGFPFMLLMVGSILVSPQGGSGSPSLFLAIQLLAAWLSRI